MKVNVTGKGFIKGVGILPARGIELSETEIRRLFNFNGVRVFDATTGMQITRATFENMKKKPVAKKVETKPAVETKPVAVEETVKPVVEEVPVVEVVEEGVKEQLEKTIAETVELNPVEVDAPAIEDTPVVEETEETITETEEVVKDTDSTDEEKKEYKPYYKKNKKNRNNK